MAKACHESCAVPWGSLNTGALPSAGGIHHSSNRPVTIRSTAERGTATSIHDQITRLNPMRAYCVALSAAITVIVATTLGLPVSSTHIAVGAIFGVGLFREWKTARQTHINHGKYTPPTAQDEEPRGLVRRDKAMYRKLVRRQHLMTIVAAWIITVPLSALLAGALLFLMRAYIL